MLRYDVLCIGSATVDQFLEITPKFSSIKLGDKILVNNTKIHTGGSATNVAATFAKSKLKTKICTKLGDDEHAEIILKELKKINVKPIVTNRSKKATDYSALISSPKDKDRVIFTHKGASQDLLFKDVNVKKLNAKWFYLGSLVGPSFSTAKKIAQIAKNKKINLLFNPSLYLAKKAKTYLKPILQSTTTLILNKQEAQALLNTKKTNEKQLLVQLQKLGPQQVIITNAAKPFYALNKKQIYKIFPPKVKIINTTGAGDAFASGFLAAILKKHSFAKALQLGQANASSVIQKLGAKNGLISVQQATQFAQKHRIEVKEV